MFVVIFEQKSQYFFDLKILREWLPIVSGDACQHSTNGKVKKKERVLWNSADDAGVTLGEKNQCSIPPSLEETDKASEKALCQTLLIHGCA